MIVALNIILPQSQESTIVHRTNDVIRGTTTWGHCVLELRRDIIWFPLHVSLSSSCHLPY